MSGELSDVSWSLGGGFQNDPKKERQNWKPIDFRVVLESKSTNLDKSLSGFQANRMSYDSSSRGCVFAGLLATTVWWQSQVAIWPKVYVTFSIEFDSEV